jgi:signal transduction histidine kinase
MVATDESRPSQRDGPLTDLNRLEVGRGSNRALLYSPSLLPIALVVLALLGSVVIPARQTWLITKLLRETTEVLAPARLLLAQLESGLAEEFGALQGYALSGDTASLERYRLLSADDDRRLVALQNRVGRIGSFAPDFQTVGQRVREWRNFNATLVRPARSGAQLGAEVDAVQARYDTSVSAIARLSSDLSQNASARDVRVRELEHLSLVSNAVLVLVALVALYAVAILTVRERRLAASLRRRVKEEAARARKEASLREAAQDLAGAFTMDEVTKRIARAALEAVDGRGAFVERITKLPDEQSEVLQVAAVAGSGVPSLGSSREFAGSYTEQVLASGEPAIIPSLDATRLTRTFGASNEAGGSAIVVPLLFGGTSLGALFVLTGRGHSRADDVGRAAIFGHLAALAYEKVSLLDEAIDGRQKLERVIASRSRLIRGFSHDVKNPIGAADGYAALLSDGVYGELNPRQQESVLRMRRCLHDALSLIDDLHELARVETGHLALQLESVDVADLIRDIGEEYQASLSASGLSFSVSVPPDLPIIRTSRSRVRQIASNLLSNAIKYTETGSVSVRATYESTGPFADTGDWVAVEFSDTGRGIPSEKFDFIFQEFSRIGDPSKSGAGLGLAISRLLAQALCGHITVASELGRGSAFTLWLPVDASQMVREKQSLGQTIEAAR